MIFSPVVNLLQIPNIWITNELFGEKNEYLQIGSHLLIDTHLANEQLSFFGWFTSNLKVRFLIAH